MTKYSKLMELAERMGPDPICLNCGRCVLIGKCCDKYEPVVDHAIWQKERDKVRVLNKLVQDLTEELKVDRSGTAAWRQRSDEWRLRAEKAEYTLSQLKTMTDEQWILDLIEGIPAAPEGES